MFPTAVFGRTNDEVAVLTQQSGGEARLHSSYIWYNILGLLQYAVSNITKLKADQT